MTRSLTALVLGIISPLAVGMAAADTITWGGGTGDFLTDANWIDGVAPVLDGAVSGGSGRAVDMRTGVPTTRRGHTSDAGGAGRNAPPPQPTAWLDRIVGSCR